MKATIENLLADTGGKRSANCETHGGYESRQIIGRIWSQCPACSSERAALEKQQQEAQERERKRLAWQERLQHSCIPERFQDRTLKNFVAQNPGQANALRFATRYADEFDAVMNTGRCAMFIGAPGTGKTHLAAGIALRLMHRDRRSVLFTTVMRAIRSIKDTWTKGSPITETQAIEALVYPDLLILDEVGVQFGSDTEKLMLFDVLNERYEKRKPCDRSIERGAGTQRSAGTRSLFALATAARVSGLGDRPASLNRADLASLASGVPCDTLLACRIFSIVSGVGR